MSENIVQCRIPKIGKQNSYICNHKHHLSLIVIITGHYQTSHLMGNPNVRGGLCFPFLISYSNLMLKFPFPHPTFYIKTLSYLFWWSGGI